MLSSSESCSCSGRLVCLRRSISDKTAMFACVSLTRKTQNNPCHFRAEGPASHQRVGSIPPESSYRYCPHRQASAVEPSTSQAKQGRSATYCASNPPEIHSQAPPALPDVSKAFFRTHNTLQCTGRAIPSVRRSIGGFIHLGVLAHRVTALIPCKPASQSVRRRSVRRAGVGHVACLLTTPGDRMKPRSPHRSARALGGYFCFIPES